MAKFSIMLFGIDSYTKENLYLPYKLEARNANAAVREARKHARVPTLSSSKMESRTWRW